MNKLPALFVTISLCISLAPKAIAVPSDGTTNAALVTEAKGTVYKRGFIDWSREKWGESQPAKVGDVLEEGMQVGTGDKSWAQIAWRYVTCRAWANSVYAIAPHQRLVYLSSGEMLFHLDKNRKGKDKDSYCLWTNLLQARVRGTTVLVQATPDRSRITVMEGTIDVLNKLDHSVVRLKPGVVLEIQAKIDVPHTIGTTETESTFGKTDERALNSPATTITPNSPSDAGKDLSSAAGVAKPAIPGIISTVDNAPLTDIISSKQAAIPLFDDIKSSTNLFLANVDVLLQHPLVTSLESDLSSLPLVQSSLSELPSIFHQGNIKQADAALNGVGQAVTDNPLLTAAAEILRAPTRSAYDVGPAVGSLIHIAPVTAALFPPQSIIGATSAIRDQAYAERISGGLRLDQAGHRVLTLSDPLFRLPVLQALISPQLPGGSNLPGAAAVGGSLIINNSVLVNPTLGTIGLTAANASAILNQTGNTTVSGFNGINGLNGLTGSTIAGLTTSRTANGSFITGTLNGLTGNLSGTLNGTLGSVSGIASGLGNTVNGTLGGVGNTLGGGLGGTVSGLGNQLGGTLGGLGGLLGGHH